MCDALGTDFRTHGNVRGTHWEYQLGTQWEQKNHKPKMRDFFQSLKKEAILIPMQFQKCECKKGQPNQRQTNKLISMSNSWGHWNSWVIA